MKKILLAAVTLGAMSSVAFAESVKLTDAQLGEVTAGQALSVSVSTASRGAASATSASSASIGIERHNPEWPGCDVCDPDAAFEFARLRLDEALHAAASITLEFTPPAE